MAKKIVWRTDGRLFEPGDEMTSAGDHALTSLNAGHAPTEQAFRDGIPNGHDLRANSLYTWRDESWARWTWDHEPDKFLYKLEIDEDETRHTGDVCWYSAAGTLIGEGKSPAEAVDAYAISQPHIQDQHYKPRVEILVKRATVLERYEKKSRNGPCGLGTG
ncbi:hypothetical protein NKH85_21385 [Mesorhizobium sp. M0924]|uniref:hypothetical protein n=1 Tax=unclassified Mesorhizobium TaxID=325217 RepID=UPI0012DE30AD|nr:MULTISPECIES: hypothetical protein [unclassified Mesorhizobium]WJI44599.1 hypothetical protein NL532_29070 [Mesorhizobium sp. C120A]